MHGVFLQVVGIFCMVPAPTCIIIPHHRMQAVHQLEPFPKRILRDMPFQEKFLFQPFGHRVGDIQPHPRSLFLEAPVVIFQHMASRPQDMRFPFGLRQLVPGNRILQLAKLSVRIVVERRCGAFAQNSIVWSNSSWPTTDFTTYWSLSKPRISMAFGLQFNRSLTSFRNE